MNDEIDIDGWDGDSEDEGPEVDDVITENHANDPYLTIYVFGRDQSTYRNKPR